MSPRDRPLLNFALLLLTALSTFATFYLVFAGGSGPERVRGAIAFSAALIAILGAHEMGHYLFARRHRVEASLPYFIPLPLLGLGTLGAVIRIRSRIPNRNALVDIGASGPLAGLLVALPVLAVGLSLSRVGDAPPLPGGFPRQESLWVLAPELWRYLADMLWGDGAAPALSVPVQEIPVFGDNLIMLLFQRAVLGPIPPGKEVFVHPLVIAGWFGLLVTMLNLIPIGQLDGGHLAHAFFGRKAERVGKAMGLLMLGLCLFFSAGWVLWLFVTAKVIGFRHPELSEPASPLSPGRKLTCALCLLALVLCAMPVPITVVTVADLGP